MVQVALAVRWVGDLEVMEIMWAAPDEVRWDRLGVDDEADLVP